MFTFTRNWFLGFAAAGALALTVASVPAIADELSLNLGAVGPNEPILKTVGSKRVIAFYETDGSHCNMTIAVWDLTDLVAAQRRVFGLPWTLVRWFVSAASPAAGRSTSSAATMPSRWLSSTLRR